jgi:hypothetical protein
MGVNPSRVPKGGRVMDVKIFSLEDGSIGWHVDGISSIDELEEVTGQLTSLANTINQKAANKRALAKAIKKRKK